MGLLTGQMQQAMKNAKSESNKAAFKAATLAKRIPRRAKGMRK